MGAGPVNLRAVSWLLTGGKTVLHALFDLQSHRSYLPFALLTLSLSPSFPSGTSLWKVSSHLFSVLLDDLSLRRECFTWPHKSSISRPYPLLSFFFFFLLACLSIQSHPKFIRRRHSLWREELLDFPVPTLVSRGWSPSWGTVTASSPTSPWALFSDYQERTQLSS